MECRKWKSKKWYGLVNRLGGEIGGVGPRALLLLEWSLALSQPLNRLLLPSPRREPFSLSHLELFIQLSYQSCPHQFLHVALKVKNVSLQLRSLLLLLYCKSRSKKLSFPSWKNENQLISPLTAVPDVGQIANSSTSQVTFTSLPKDHFWW